MRGETTIACRTLGTAAEIEWTRDGAVFSGSETYRQTGREVHLVNVTIQDAGYYYCTAQGPGGETKTASIQVKVGSAEIRVLLMPALLCRKDFWTNWPMHRLCLYIKASWLYVRTI